MTDGRDDGLWRSQPLLAAGVRVLQYGVPLAGGTMAARGVVGLIGDRVPVLLVSACAAVAAIGVSLVVSRLTSRLAPLAVLLGMTMVFPDRAPSRLKVARRSTSVSEIRGALEGPDADAHEAALTMLALVTALGRHDRRTRGHSERVRLFCDLLSGELGLPEHERGRLRWAALVHDIGKLEVAAGILAKPGVLNADEWASVRQHPAAGAQLARPLAAWLGTSYPGIIEHHERFDGGGYPRGLVGPQISLAGRAIAVVDAFETMTAARSYKAARSVVAARAELTRCAGTHFDPAMVRAFLSISLPRLLWTLGPLAFVLNAPFVRWVGEGGGRLVDAAGSGAAGAVHAAGVTAVVVASGTLPIAGAAAPVTPTPTLARQHAGTHVAADVRAGRRGGPAHAGPGQRPTPTTTTTSTHPPTATHPTTKPTKPAKPTKPTGPTKGTKPTRATQPAGSARPTKAPKPARATRPARPTTAGGPAAATTPSKPVRSTGPGNPVDATPDRPATPTEGPAAGSAAGRGPGAAAAQPGSGHAPATPGPPSTRDRPRTSHQWGR